MVAQLWAQLGWDGDDEKGRDRVQQAFSGSTWVAIAQLQGQFAEYARALRDGILVTYLTEIAVLPSLRRKGIGGALIQACLDTFQHTAIYANAAPDVVGLNARYGLTPRPNYLIACAKGPVTPAPGPASSGQAGACPPLRSGQAEAL
jgi:GNAT superfamily N-acetyltransferase